MNIAIIGTRGIPNHYGGFEQFAEYLAKGLVERGHDITVYNSHLHPYQQAEWNGVKLVHCQDPEDRWGTVGQFVYDLNCILDTRKKNFDIILQLGYTSSTIWGWLLPRNRSVVTTNMDGLEWSRSKYAKPVQWFLKQAEYLATVFSDHWIADSLGIQDYLTKKYQIPSTYIPYGAFSFTNPKSDVLNAYQVNPYAYNMLVARFEPENNLDTILEGAAAATKKTTFLVVGKHETKYGAYLKDKFKAATHIRFIGGVYDIEILNNLRYYSNLYFHGHSVGGTNPSLLEAMASQALICANRNLFNSTILEDDAFYFSNASEVSKYIDATQKEAFQHYVKNNLQKIDEIYEWNKIIDQYEDHFKKIYATKK